MSLQPDPLGKATTDYAIQVSYRKNPGLLAAPVAGPVGTPCQLVRVHAPVCFKVVDWTATAVGGKPVVPSNAPASANEVLLDDATVVGVPTPALDGSQTWTISGQYTYLLLVPPGPSDPLPVGTSPLLGGSAGDNVLSPGDFSDVLLGGGTVRS